MAEMRSTELSGSRVPRRASGRIMLVCGILAAGVLLRALPIGGSAGAARPALSAACKLPPDAAGLPGLIQAFYQDLNTGRYRQAFERAFEASWFLDLRLDTNRNIEDNRVVALTPLETLVARAKSELGEKGERLSILDLTVDDVEALTDPSDWGEYQDVRLLSKLNSYRTIEKAYIARVDGQIYSTFCAHSGWQKRLVLVKFRGDPTFRMFLNGARNVVGSFTQEWFLDRKVNPLAERLEWSPRITSSWHEGVTVDEVERLLHECGPDGVGRHCAALRLVLQEGCIATGVKKLDSKVAVVTGGNREIGKAITARVGG